ncbi:MAG: hypothetical protein ACOCVX_05750, partial [Bacteroidales bacterium]
CFDEDESELFIGIGTLLGFDFPSQSKKLVFSTGAAIDKHNYYGKIPALDDTWEIICVRGPLTAELLKIDKKYAVTDGAVLVKEMVTTTPEKKYPCSFMPHLGSLQFGDFSSFFNRLGIHYIDPRQDPHFVINEILSSEKLLSEAMHGAIVADALRIPWIPVKMFRQVNEYKWMDWQMSLGMENKFTYLHEVFDKNFLVKISKHKFNINSKAFHLITSSLYEKYQSKVVLANMEKKLHGLKKRDGFLSEENKLNNRVEQLLEMLHHVKKQNV